MLQESITFKGDHSLGFFVACPTQVMLSSILAFQFNRMNRWTGMFKGEQSEWWWALETMSCGKRRTWKRLHWRQMGCQQLKVCSREKKSDLLCMWPRSELEPAVEAAGKQIFTEYKSRSFLSISAVQVCRGLPLQGISAWGWSSSPVWMVNWHVCRIGAV